MTEKYAKRYGANLPNVVLVVSPGTFKPKESYFDRTSLILLSAHDNGFNWS